jgi:hypothetical protein
MAFDFGGALNNVLDKGLDVWVDSEKARPFSAGAQTPSTRDASGNAVATGQASGTLSAAIQSNPAVWIGVAAVVVLLIVLAVKK